MKRRNLFILGVLAVVAVVYSASSFSEEKAKGMVVDLKTQTCRDLLKMPGDERDFTLIYYHGLISGMKQELIFNGPVLSEATDKVINQCIDHPDDKLLKVFKEARQ